MWGWQELISKDSVIQMLDKEEISYFLYNDTLLFDVEGDELIVADLHEPEIIEKEDEFSAQLKMGMEYGHPVLLLNVQDACLMMRLTGVGFIEHWILIIKGKQSNYIYVSDAPKYMNTTTYSNKKIAVQGEYLLENKKRKGKQKFTVNYEFVESYFSRQMEVLKDRLRTMQNQQLAEVLEVENGERNTYIIINENYAIDNMQKVANEVIWKITVQKEDGYRIGISSAGTRFCPSSIGKLLADEENDRGYFQNRLELGVESCQLSPKVLTSKGAGLVEEFDFSIFESESKVTFDYQMSKTREGIVSIYEYDIRYDRPCISSLPKGSKLGLDLEAYLEWEVEDNALNSVPVALQWMTEYYACRVPIPSMMWEKKIVVDQSLFINIMLLI